MVRRENEKSVDSRFLKNVWGIRNLHTRFVEANVLQANDTPGKRFS
jgi:hypothetical protein